MTIVTYINYSGELSISHGEGPMNQATLTETSRTDLGNGRELREFTVDNAQPADFQNLTVFYRRVGSNDAVVERIHYTQSGTHPELIISRVSPMEIDNISSLTWDQLLRGDDTIRSANDSDVIYGFAGRDSIQGSDGNDSIFGGPGSDTLDGSRDNDRIFGGRGSDMLRGQEDSDRLSGGAGSDTIYGGRGRDLLFGDGGMDTLNGGGNRDILRGGPGNDTVLGDAGSDHLFGGFNSDTLVGGSGNDRLDGGRGNDSLKGGIGSDHFIFHTPSGRTGNDRILDFETDADVLVFSRLYRGTLDFSYVNGDTHITYGGDETLIIENEELLLRDLTLIFVN